MQDRISEIDFLENYVNSLIDSHHNRLNYTTKAADKKLLEARMDTFHAILTYFSERKIF